MLKYISLNGCTEMTDNSLFAIGEHCPLIREANFSHCVNTSARGVYCLIRSCRGLYKLKLSSCTGISDDDIVELKENQQTEIVDQQTEMKDLQTGTTDQQTETKDLHTEAKDQRTETKDSQLISNFTTHSHLKAFNLRSCTNISKEALLRFTGICPDYRGIFLFDCINNSEDHDFIFRVIDDYQFL